MTATYNDPNNVINVGTGSAVPASWFDTVRDNQEQNEISPGCHAVYLNNTSVSNNTLTAIVLDGTDIWDTDSYHSPSSNPSRAIVPAGLGGRYDIIGSILFATNSNGFRQLNIRVNGSTDYPLIAVPSTSGAPTLLTASIALPLVATNYVEVCGYQNSGGALLCSGRLILQRRGR